MFKWGEPIRHIVHCEKIHNENGLKNTKTIFFLFFFILADFLPLFSSFFHTPMGACTPTSQWKYARASVLCDLHIEKNFFFNFFSLVFSFLFNFKKEAIFWQYITIERIKKTFGSPYYNIQLYRIVGFLTKCRTRLLNRKENYR